MQSGASSYEPMANMYSVSNSGRSTNDSDDPTSSSTSPPSSHSYQNTPNVAAVEVHSPGAPKHTYSDYDHLEEEEEKPAKNAFSVYDRLEPPPESPYAVLGNIEEVDLTSFAYQIASGMVGNTEALHGSSNELYLDITDI